MLIIPPDILAQLKRHAALEYPRECCGILIGRKSDKGTEIQQALPAANLADTNRLHDRYAIDPLLILQADRQATAQSLDIIGFYHSHPDHPPQPSKTDLAAAWSHYVYLIISVTAAGVAEMRAWQLVEQDRPMHEIAIQPGVPNPPP